MPAKVLILNGPNLNLLGDREPQIYGHETLADIEATAKRHGEGLGLEIDFRQSNHEGQLIDWIHGVRGDASGIVINAGGLTHTSVALLDALISADMPVIEVHLSNIYRRDEFRRHSYIAQAATGSICGFGSHSYVLALDAMARLIERDGS